MERKDNSSVGSGAQDTASKSLSYEDKYSLLVGENQKLRRQIGRLCDALRDWRDRALFLRAERDRYKGETVISCPLSVSCSCSDYPEDEVRLERIQAQAKEACSLCSCKSLCGRGNSAL